MIIQGLTPIGKPCYFRWISFSLCLGRLAKGGIKHIGLGKLWIINPNCRIEPKAYHEPVAEKQTGKGILPIPLF